MVAGCALQGPIGSTPLATYAPNRGHTLPLTSLTSPCIFPTVTQFAPTGPEFCTFSPLNEWGAGVIKHRLGLTKSGESGLWMFAFLNVWHVSDQAHHQPVGCLAMSVRALPRWPDGIPQDTLKSPISIPESPWDDRMGDLERRLCAQLVQISAQKRTGRGDREDRGGAFQGNLRFFDLDMPRRAAEAS